MADIDTIEDGSGWLSVHDASAKMGVSPATLRVWADEGRIESYRTPGGHRRFRLGGSTTPFTPEKRITDTRWRLLEHSALGRVRLAGEAREEVRALLPPQARNEQRTLEREFIGLCVQGVSHLHVDMDVRAVALGNAYAKFHWRYGVTIGEAVKTLGSFRIAFTESVVEFAFAIGEPRVDELNLWLGRVNELIDRVCVSMLEYRNENETVNARRR